MKLPMPDSRHEFTAEEVKKFFPINDPRRGWHKILEQFVLLIPEKPGVDKWHVYVYFRDPRKEFEAIGAELNQISKLGLFTLPQ